MVKSNGGLIREDLRRRQASFALLKRASKWASLHAKGVFYSSTEQPYAMTGSAIANIHINNLATILIICFDIILPCGQGLPLMLVYVISVRAPKIQYLRRAKLVQCVSVEF